ncbi:MAG: hypothetical protein ACXVRJ_14810 [Gaiellaceae bacterium]
MTMHAARFAALFAVLAAAATLVAGASSADIAPPTGLHGFLLRADEPLTTDFHRTPSFAWSPVPGAISYQFQLSTSSAFRENSTLYDDRKLTTPVAAPPLTLPWITGSPHALYARVRAVLDSTTTQWSASYGFDVTPPPPPTPLPSYPGLLRWTPLEGAEGYQVWLIDTGKMEYVRTNVLDEREFYTFHQTLPWISTVRWRIRALRGDVFNYRVNGMPAAMHGAWSPIYSSSNPAVTAGQLKLTGTVSDVFSNGTPTSPAHRFMPAFMWTGTETMSGATAELYRVYVFTDSSCLNRVYSSAVVGSQVWSPRLTGPLSLPGDNASLTAARSGYLGDGKESNNLTADFEIVPNGPNEQWPQATPTTLVPGDVPAATGTTPPPDPTGSAAAAAGAGGGSSNISVGSNLGPPIDLWDTNWPESGYYWTVIPVVPIGLGVSGTVAPPGAAKGATSIPVTTTTGFRIGDAITIGLAPSADSATITGVGAGTLTLATPTTFAHLPGDDVIHAGGSVVYQDMELPQEVCAAGRVQRFGIESEPSLTTGSAPFVTGLSPSGRLTSAASTPAFYGAPLIAWTPAFGADVYEVQYSKTKYPFKPEIDPRSKTTGILTFLTSDVLPFRRGAMAGTWWYRVRGIDYNLPTGVQQMGWSDPEKLVVTKPTLKIVTGAKKKFKVVGK